MSVTQHCGAEAGGPQELAIQLVQIMNLQFSESFRLKAKGQKVIEEDTRYPDLTSTRVCIDALLYTQHTHNVLLHSKNKCDHSVTIKNKTL